MGRLKSRSAAISRRIPRLKEPIKASRWIEKLVSYPDEVAETCPGRYGGEAEMQTRVPSPFELAARNDGQGEQHARDRSCFAQYRNNGFAAHRR
jgi:hypothetical protein